MNKVILYNLKPSEYEHPADKAANATLNKFAILQEITKKIIKILHEKQLQLITNGSKIRFSDTQYPDVYHIFQECCSVLQMDKEPPFYLEPGRELNAYTTGVNTPILCVNERTVEALTEDELRFIIGHELGHIKSHHCLNHTLAKIISEGTSIIADISTAPIKEALLAWDRMSEFTADRAGLLCCQSLEAAVTALGKLGGCVIKYKDEFNYEAFLNQALTFKKEQGSLLHSAKKALLNFMYEMSHPLTVLRAAEIYEWSNSEQYQSIINSRKNNIEVK